jgi:peptidoglycan/LPS O-acetylase OafA/YrhL
MDATTQSGRRLGRAPALDGLRAVAVTLVILLHVGLVAGGYVGVDVFLPLSGFLITALLYDEWERTGEIALPRFLIRRARRLLPALVLLLAVFAIVMLALRPWAPSWPLGRLIASTLLFANNWVTTFAPSHGAVLGALSPTWTLAQEAQFYLVWPPLLRSLLGLRAGPRAVLALIVVAIAGLLLAAPLVAHVAGAYNAYTSPLDRGAELLFGCAAAIVWRERLVPAALTRPITGWLLAGAIAAVVVACPIATPDVYLAAAALTALLLINLLTPGPRSRIPGPSRLLSLRPLPFTGGISYGIYLYHVPIYWLVWTYLPLGSRYWYGAVVLGLSIAAALVSYRLVEAPALRARRRRPALRVIQVGSRA